MNKFIGREIELKNLNNMYRSDKFEMAVIYGRRRVGKTSLIKQLLSNKLAIYVQGVQATAETNLRFLSNAILDFEEPKRINRHKTFFDFAESSAEISSILQYTIDHIYKEKNNIMLILCGSSMSFMEHQVLGYKSPLYGRKTGQFKIRPFDIFTTKKMLSKVNNEDLLAYYGITDGIPQYLSFIDQTKSVEENKNELNKKTPPVKTTSGIFSKYLSINFTYLD